MEEEKTDELMRILQRHIPAVVSSLGVIIGGILAMIHDKEDFGKFDHIHHWLLGLIGLISGIILLGIELYFLVEDLRERGFIQAPSLHFRSQ